MKNKNKKIAGVALIALCLSFLVFGVYAAKNAKLTASGSVGFIAHECTATITATIQGDAVINNGTAESPDYVTNEDGHVSPEREYFPGEVTIGGATEAEINKTISTADTTPTIPKIYFTDLTEDGIPEEIVITFSVTNTSDYPIDVTLTHNTELDMGKVTVSYENATVTSLQPEANTDLKVKFNLEATDGDYVDFEEDIAYSLKLDLKKSGNG